ncbi:MAG: ATP-binding protein, partial [Alphaproteobacteria bacterium]|nr:ATP-binding protein [Alphaproteobacteria bacterium]
MHESKDWFWNAAFSHEDRVVIAERQQAAIEHPVEAGSHRLRFTAERETGTIAIDVADDGPGLPPKARENLFRPFFGSARPGGSGLGLAIARELVRAHGGELSLASSSGAGTVFRLSLRAPAARHVSRARAGELSSGGAGSTLRDGLLSRQRHRNVVEAHGIFEHQPVERGLAEGRLRRSMPLRFGMRPRAVETGEIARPQEVAEADLRHAPETALLLDLKCKEDLASHEFTGLVGQRNVGRED